jgi:hypothetical protein
VSTCKPARSQEDLLGRLRATFADQAADLEAYFHAGPRPQRRLGQAGARLEDQFRLVLGPRALDAIAARMDRGEAAAGTGMARKQLRDVALELTMWEVCQGLREEDAAVELPGETFKAHGVFMREQLAEFLEATRRR